MEVELLTIGDEILIGQTVDTNSAWMAKSLNAIGLKVGRINSIADTGSAIKSALKEIEKRSSIILMTGGLGPTKDDITKKTLCEYFDTTLVRNQEVLQKIERFFAQRGREMLESNRAQADLPESCEVLPNFLGTASGMWFEKNNSIFVSMPGVPYEMKGLMEKEVIPRLQKRFQLPRLYHKTIMTEGIAESFLSEKIRDWEAALGFDSIHIAYLPSPGVVKIRLSAEGVGSYDAFKQKVDKHVERLKKLIPEYIFGEDDILMQEAIAELLKKENKTLSLAESCTGGNLAQLITSVAGSSDYFMGSVVSYSNRSKADLLGVSFSDINNYGAVSKAVVMQMALGARRKFETDYALATSGVAGPDGGSKEKPVGTVWIAVAGKEGVFAKRFLLEKDRGRNIKRASLAALSMLRRALKGQLNFTPLVRSSV